MNEARRQDLTEEFMEEVTEIAAEYDDGTLPLEDLIDIDKELERLGKEKERLEGEMKRVNAKLANEEFVKKAPEKVINAEREKQAKYQEMLDNVLSRIDALKK